MFAPESELLAETTGNWRALLSEEEKADDIERLRLHTRTGRPLGGVMFLNLMESLLKRPVLPRRPGRPRKSKGEK